jgi:ubiquinone/menaquinone biosynthesis C-methylase UbiE
MLSRELEPEVMDTPEDSAEYTAMDHAGPNEAFVARLMKLGADGLMLDLGTGPGDIPLMICQTVDTAEVVGVDAAKTMLRHAMAKTAENPQLAERIRWVEADVKDLPYPEATFDVVFSNTVLHHMPQPEKMLSEAWRVLKPGGALLIRDLYRPPTRARLVELVTQHADGATPQQRRLFAESLRAALTPPELIDLAERVGIGQAEVVIDTDRHMSLQRPMRAKR